ncbi:GEVED domain-containing protein [uncultured Chryseobacterium sp.]|uniref:GEVED domain-containing protein n=1 Tax=uncultured Chryseobacterium sp. TaxID=259322 RepID=UPI0025D2306B|nr:GEVED domain-containing protein [uncultured Chryseobacterium sp.]
MKTILLSGLFAACLLNAQSAPNPCTSNLGGDVDPSFIEIRINSTSFDHQTFASQNVFYHDYPSSGNTTATLVVGQSYQIYTSTSSEAVIGFWLDTNQNSIFEPQEYTQLVNSMNTQNTTVFTVPVSAASGNTRMRIRSRAYGSSINSNNACTTFGSGETRDYTLNITGAQLGTREVGPAGTLNAYPNPTTDFLQIEGKELILSAEIYNMEGRKIGTRAINAVNALLNLSEYAPGEYLVRIFTRSDNRTFKIYKK